LPELVCAVADIEANSNPISHMYLVFIFVDLEFKNWTIIYNPAQKQNFKEHEIVDLLG